MKRTAKILIVLTICILLGLWSPWMALQIDIPSLFGVNRPADISGLHVFSLSGQMRVFIDDEEVGTVTPEESPLVIDAVSPGEKLIRLERVTEVPGAFWTFSKVINFRSNVNVVLSYALGPREEFSEGHTITVEPLRGLENNLLITTNVEDVDVLADNIAYTTAGNKLETSVSLDSQVRLRFSKPGFDEIEFTILPEDQEERDFLKDFVIVVDVHMIYQPVDVS